MLLNKMKKFLHYMALLLGLAVMNIVYAAPESDELGRLIEQKQTKPTQQPDHESLDNLIRNKTENADERHTARPLRERETTAGDVVVAGKNNNDADELLSSAMGFLGVAYRFGGTSPTGFDCSGFMQYIFRKAYAVNLPRTSAQQATVGTAVSRENLQAGDMVFFRTAGGGRISHVGMYVGNNRFIHAPRTGKRIEITSLSNQYWHSKYAFARRVKRNNAQ